MNDYDKIIEIAKEYDVITFDVFDTLIIRDIKKPTDLFRRSYGFWGRYIRVLAEIIARRFSKIGEVQLKDIQRFCPFRLEKEIALEYDLCRANPKIFDIYMNLVQNGKRIYALSDMYLPSNIIEHILKENGYEIPVIVSCEEGKNKKSGKLFESFLNRYNYSAEQVLHIGDNVEADFNGAQKCGLKSVLVQRHSNVLTYTKNKYNNSEMASFINHGLNDLDNPVEKIGYEIVGPIILSFCQWVHNKYREEKFERLFFLARDMQFTYDIYKTIYPDDNIEYLYVSRKAFLYSRENKEDFIKYLKDEHCFGNVAIVDTGWLGNAQVEIEKYSKIIDSNSDIGGLYLGIKLTSKFIKRSDHTYCCLFPDFCGQFQCELYPPFMETLIGSNDKQVISYNNGTPIFDREESRDKTNSIKDGSRKFIVDWVNYKNNKNIDARTARKAFIKMFRYPINEHIFLIGGLHYEDFKDTRIVSFDDNYNYIKNVKKWLSDLSYSGWKGAFFKKSFGLFYIPFLIIYIYINGLRNMLVDIKKIKKKEL